MGAKYVLGGLVGAAAAVAICGASATASQGTAGNCQSKGILVTGLAAVGGVALAAFFAEQFGASRMEVSDAQSGDKSEVKPPEILVDAPQDPNAEREMVSLK